MPQPRTRTSIQATPPVEETRLVWAAPGSTVGARCPLVRTGTITATVETSSGVERLLDITATVELELLEDQYPGRYVMKKITIADGDGGGVTPELLRSIKFAPLIGKLTANGVQRVILDGDRVIDHHNPDRSLTADQNLAGLWLEAKLCGVNTNDYVAAALGITPAASAQRIARLRREGMLPPAEGPGARR